MISGGRFGAPNQPVNPMTGIGLTQAPDPLAYKPKDGYLSQFTVDPTGVIKSKFGAQDFVMNGVSVDLKKLGAAEGTGGAISKMKVDNNGNLFGQLSYQVANPNYGKYSRSIPMYGSAWSGLPAIDNNKTISKSEWQQLSGFQLDMDTISKSRGGAIPDANNIYIRPDGNSFVGDIEAIWEGGRTFTAAVGRTRTNKEIQPSGERLSASRGSQRKTSTLGGAPSSKADGNSRADDINLRNRKGTLLT